MNSEHTHKHTNTHTQSINHSKTCKHSNLYTGASAIGKGLQHVPDLTSLYQSRNSIGDTGASAIGKGLQHVPHLTLLELVGDDGWCLSWDSSADSLCGVSLVGYGHILQTDNPISYFGLEWFPTWQRMGFDKHLHFGGYKASPPLELFAQGEDAVRAFFADTDTVPIIEARMMLCGRGMAGKTTLARALDSDDGKCPPDHIPGADQRTVGIELLQLHLDCSVHVDGGVEQGTLHLWDFGGQDTYLAAHTLLFSPRCTYVLMLHPDTAEATLEDQAHEWLDALHAAAPQRGGIPHRVSC